MINLLASAFIPEGTDPFNTIVFGLLGGLTQAVGYGFAIILFAVILRLALLPLDVLNKYFTKRNAIRTAEFKEEDAELKKQFAAEPMKYLSARREMYRRNGYKPGPSMFVMLGNMVVTTMIFFAVFACLNQISSANLDRQSRALHVEYVRHAEAGTLVEGTLDGKTFREDINYVYQAHTEPFLWVHNVFRADTFFADKIPSLAEFRNAVDVETVTSEKVEEAYNFIFSRNEDGSYSGTGLSRGNSRGSNGYMVFLVIVPVTMFFSMQINMTAMQKKKAAETKKEVEVGYSMRQAKAQVDPGAVPQIDPQKMMKYMKFLMPAMMILFVFSSAAAFALYIAVGAIMQTTLGLASNKIIDTILKKQEAKNDGEKPKHPVINPHTRYFKKRG